MGQTLSKSSPQIATDLLLSIPKDIDRITCSICWNVLNNPVLLNNSVISPPREACCHHFCEQCIISHLKINQTCPLCRKPTELHHLVKNMEKQREIGDMMIKCVYQEKGCNWSGKIGLSFSNYTTHFTTCSNRGKVCEKCLEMIDWTSLNTHFAVCSAEIVTCTRNKDCGSQFRRDEEKKHIEFLCKYRPASCPFSSYNRYSLECKSVKTVFDLEKHTIAFNNLHFTLSETKISDLQKQVAVLKSENSNLSQQLSAVALDEEKSVNDEKNHRIVILSNIDTRKRRRKDNHSYKYY